MLDKYKLSVIYVKDLDLYSQNDILTKLPRDVQCWYAPRDAFVDELMSKVSKMLHVNGKIVLFICI